MSRDLIILYAVLLNCDGRVKKVIKNEDDSYSIELESLLTCLNDQKTYMRIAKIRLTPNRG